MVQDKSQLNNYFGSKAERAEKAVRKERVREKLGRGYMECKKDRNLKKCSCTYEPCSRKGICCDCIAYHWKNRELPGCFFPPEVERTYDRSLECFIRTYKGR
jgi:hypothetical protein